MNLRKWLLAGLVLLLFTASVSAASGTSWIASFFGNETVQTPAYLIIWILQIAVVSGMIIELTKLRPAWFRGFTACTYTLLPLVVQHYFGNIALSFIVIAVETIILMLLAVGTWKNKKLSDLFKAFK